MSKLDEAVEVIAKDLYFTFLDDDVVTMGGCRSEKWEAMPEGNKAISRKFARKWIQSAVMVLVPDFHEDEPYDSFENGYGYCRDKLLDNAEIDRRFGAEALESDELKE